MIEYFKEGDLRSPASETEISQLEKDLGFGLPADYREFLLLSDGYNGYVGAKGYAQLWPVGELTSNNEGYDARSRSPISHLSARTVARPLTASVCRRGALPSCQYRSCRWRATKSGRSAVRLWNFSLHSLPAKDGKERSVPRSTSSWTCTRKPRRGQRALADQAGQLPQDGVDRRLAVTHGMSHPCSPLTCSGLRSPVEQFSSPSW